MELPYPITVQAGMMDMWMSSFGAYVVGVGFSKRFEPSVVRRLAVAHVIYG